jgi:GTP-binding protein EngB required for normal cell division
MPAIGQLFSIEFSSMIFAGTAVRCAPRIGAGRAAWIALRSRFASKPMPQSIRSSEIQLLKRVLAKKNFGQSYVVVMGEKGVGKSCLLSTVTSKTPGVIHIEAKPCHNQDDIVNNTEKALTSPPFGFRPLTTMPRVIFWHRLFTGGRAPIVVIKATEREPGEGYAGLTGAVRTLVDKFRLRVVVDASPSSVSESLLQTIRQRVFNIRPMTRDMIWQLDQLQDLFKYVKEASLDDAVFAVLGGIPSRYENLWNNTEDDLQTGQDARQVIGSYLCDQIYAAIKLINDSKSTKDMKEILELFDKDTNVISSHLVKAKKLKRPTPDNVFREVEQDGVFVLVPASNAIGIVLRHSLTKEPTLDELEKLIKRKN